jgi:hypothetical protein
MMPADNYDAAVSNILDIAPQRRGNFARCRNAIGHGITDNEIVQPPLSVDRDEPQPANVDYCGTGTSIPRKQANVFPVCQRGDHPLLEPNGIQSKRASTRPVVIPGNEHTAHALGNSVHLIGKTAARIRVFGSSLLRNSVGINVVAKKYDHRPARRFSRLSSQ